MPLRADPRAAFAWTKGPFKGPWYFARTSTQQQAVGWTFLQAIGGSSMKLAVLMPGVPQAQDVYVHIKPSEIYSAG